MKWTTDPGLYPEAVQSSDLPKDCIYVDDDLGIAICQIRDDNGVPLLDYNGRISLRVIGMNEYVRCFLNRPTLA